MTNRRFIKLINFVTLLMSATAFFLTTASARDDASLFGKKWILTEVHRTAVNTTRAYIEFDRDAKHFSGSGGCNSISGGFSVDGTKLKFSKVIGTQMACVDSAVQQAETDFLKTIERTTRYQIQDDTLRLFAGNSPILTFRSDTAGTGGNAPEVRVTGTVAYLQRIALTPDAIVEVKLLDISRADAQAVTIAEQEIKPVGKQVPIPFELRYDPSRIKKSGHYAIQARILEGGQLKFINTTTYLVITGGHPDTVKVIVKPVRK